jgi:NADP-dependent 3-hydroxy acid dehydrogenase YdfG
MAKQPRSLADRVVAITGGARGIGRATAEALAREGARVAIGDLDAALARRTAEEIGPQAAAFELDVTDRASFERFVDDVQARLGPVDVLVNNAGIMPLGPFTAEDDATARRLVDVNVHGVLIGMKVVLPRFVARGEGHLVNIASAAGKGPYPGGATYCGTKHFVVGVSETVRGELRGTGVNLSVVMPVVFDTELATGVGTPRGIPRIEPDDVAAAIVGTLRRPRFDVYVPRSIGPLTALGAVLPRPVREWAMRAIGADRVLWRVDAAARRKYELRAAHAGAVLEPAAEPPALTEAGR